MENTQRTERLLALILISQMKGASKQEKAYQLNLAGFANFEIADILDTNTRIISALLHQKKQRRKTTVKK